ncbi:hypothetical protein LCGC14_2739140 [marine sediment metagenome]|uniref:Uncharacterized protein n=1 Tax=marine sediment metagenome TaxID=412755 RepID=A0A0F9BDZ1_9ZZZZ
MGVGDAENDKKGRTHSDENPDNPRFLSGAQDSDVDRGNSEHESEDPRSPVRVGGEGSEDVQRGTGPDTPGIAEDGESGTT